MQKFLALHKARIVQVWYALLIAWLGFFLYSATQLSFLEWLPLGTLSASVSIVAFWLALTPGIMKRLNFSNALLPLRTSLMLYRRQIGITMYLFALTHFFWSRALPIYTLGGDLTVMSPFEVMGMTAFTLLTPVFLTSNEWSVRTFGRRWKTIHALVYIVVWILLLHIGFQGTSWQATGTLIVAVLETISLFWDILRRSKKPVENAPLP